MGLRKAIISVALGTVTLLWCSRGYADGLICDLPPDGAWVRYQATQGGEIAAKMPEGVEVPEAMRASLPKTVQVRGTLILSSVGRVMVADEPCRWIELKSDMEFKGKSATGRELPPPPPRRIILKMLIPERHLARGEDALAHVLRLYFKDTDRPAELVEDAKAKQYELDRFRPFFPQVPTKETKTARKTIVTPDAKLPQLECEQLTFLSSYEGPLTRGRRGWWSWQGTHEIWLAKEVPFGVASLRLSANSDEWSEAKGRGALASVKGTQYLVVLETGTGAKSELPEQAELPGGGKAD